MSKFSKKSLAALTAAAIMASTASIVSYAAWTSAATVTANGATITLVSINDGSGNAKLNAGADAEDMSAVAAGGAIVGNFKVNGDAGDTFTIKVEAPENQQVKSVKIGSKTLTADGGNYVFDYADFGALVVEVGAVGGTSSPTPEGEENTDKVVWVNGKDTKANAKTGTPASLYKSENYEQVMMSAGGKWQVAVTPATVATVEDFLKEFDEKGKLTNAKDYKNLASAKVKEGTVTVTAGKEGGAINVWVYEVKAKAVVNTEQVKPVATPFTVKVAPTMVVTATPVKVTDGAVPAIAKADKLEKSYAPGSEVLAYFGDKKAATSLDATFVLMDGKNPAELKDGKFVGEGFTAELVAAGENGPAVKITIAADAKEKAKIAVSVKNVESGKVAKISTTVGKAEEKKDDDTTGGDTTGGDTTGGNTDTPAA